MAHTQRSILIKISCALILLVAGSLSSNGQTNSLFISSYYGDFGMKDIKAIQSNTLAETTLPLQMTEEVSGYWGYELNYNTQLSNKNALGFYSGLTSTGGRLHYADFSGSAFFDIIANAFYMGSEFTAKLNESEEMDINLSFRVGTTFTGLKFQSGLTLVSSNSSTSEEVTSRSLNVHLGPYISVQRSFGNLVLRAFSGYEYNFTGKVRLKENKEAFLVNDDGGKLGTDWGGLRIGLSLGIRL